MLVFWIFDGEGRELGLGYGCGVDAPAGDGIVRVRRETKGRRGKGVTTIEGVATNLQAAFPLATPNVNILAAGISLHEFTISSPDIPAGKYSSGVLIDSPNIEIYNNEFISRQGDVAPTEANDGLTNVILQTWAGSDFGRPTTSMICSRISRQPCARLPACCS